MTIKFKWIFTDQNKFMSMPWVDGGGTSVCYKSMIAY